MWKQSWVFSGLFLAHMGVACSSDTCSIECGSLPESSSAAGVEPTTPPGVEPTASGTDASNGDVAPALPSMPNTESDDSSSAPPASSPAPRLRALSTLSAGTEFFLALTIAS